MYTNFSVAKMVMNDAVHTTNEMLSSCAVSLILMHLSSIIKVSVQQTVVRGGRDCTWVTACFECLSCH